jgi:hypothetical protein
MFSFTCSALKRSSLPASLQFCQTFLQSFLKTNPEAEELFGQVDVDRPDYLNVIKHPMDFATIGRKIIDSEYRDLPAFKADIDLVWSNSRVYDPPDSLQGRASVRLHSLLDSLWDIHVSAGDPDAARRLLDEARRAQWIADALEVCDANPGMAAFDMPSVRPPPPPAQAAPRALGKAAKPERVRPRHKDDPGVPRPKDYALPMCIRERYDLAVALNTLPVELLWDIVKILKEAKVNFAEPVSIPITSLDAGLLRRIEAVTNDIKKKDVAVRAMRQMGRVPISAGERIELLEREKKVIEAKLRQKHPDAKSGEVTSDSETEGSSTHSSSDGDLSDSGD